MTTSVDAKAQLEVPSDKATELVKEAKADAADEGAVKATIVEERGEEIITA